MKNKVQNKKCIVEIYNKCKYKSKILDGEILRYNSIDSWEVLTGDKAKEFEKTIDKEMIDDNHEYLILYKNEIPIASFRNSYVDLFLHSRTKMRKEIYLEGKYFKPLIKKLEKSEFACWAENIEYMKEQNIETEYHENTTLHCYQDDLIQICVVEKVSG